MSPLPPSDASEARSGEGSASRRRRGTKVLLVSLVLSALLHLLVVLLLPTFQVETSGRSPEAAEEGEPREEGVEIVELTEAPGADPGPLVRPAPPEEPEEPEEDEPEEDEVDQEPPEEVEEATVEPAGEGEAGDAPTVAERLRTPTAGDARLWRPVDPDLTELTPDERALIGIYIRLQAMSDSVITAEERERQAREWVFTDDEGRRWGISPGTIYFGEDSIQVPLLDRFQLSGPPTVEGAARQWELNDIRRAAEVARVRDAWDERRDAIRERIDAEREEARSREAEETQPADSTGAGGS